MRERERGRRERERERKRREREREREEEEREQVSCLNITLLMVLVDLVSRSGVWNQKCRMSHLQFPLHRTQHIPSLCTACIALCLIERNYL